MKALRLVEERAKSESDASRSELLRLCQAVCSGVTDDHLTQMLSYVKERTSLHVNVKLRRDIQHYFNDTQFRSQIGVYIKLEISVTNRSDHIPSRRR